MVATEETTALVLKPEGLRKILLDRVGDRGLNTKMDLLSRIQAFVGMPPSFLRDVAQRLTMEHHRRPQHTQDGEATGTRSPYKRFEEAHRAT